MTFFDELRGVWKCGETLPECFINLLIQYQIYRESGERKSSKCMLIKIKYPKQPSRSDFDNKSTIGNQV